MEEPIYRQQLDRTLQRIEAAFDEVDPDLVEPIRSGDTLTLAFGDGSRAILSPQPPLRQLWLAARARGYHFSLDPAGDRWLDKDGQPLEAVLQDLIRQSAGISVRLG